MKMLKQTTSLWSPECVKSFAVSVREEWGAGWDMLSQAAKNNAIRAQVAVVIMSQPDDRKISCGQATLLYNDILYTIFQLKTLRK